MSRRVMALATPRIHHDALDWVRRVVSQGGSCSQSTLRAVSAFCDAIDRAGIRDRFFRVNLFCGHSDASLIAVRTPLFRGPSLTGTQFGNATDTNFNFVAGDYAETGASGGLQGNGTSKYLNTGLAPSGLPQSQTMHLSAYRGPGAMSNRGLIGARTVADAYLLFRRGDNLHTSAIGQFIEARLALGSTEPGLNDGGLYIAARTSATSLEFRRNNTQIAINTTSASPTAITLPLFVFNFNESGTPAAGGFFPARLMGYSIGDGLTASQADSFYTAMQAFQTALGRQV